jgi:sulfite exporter TauE/SafE
VIAALLLGFFGSLHCAGMCGPLVLITPVIGNTPASIIASRALYHSGRIAVYVLLGLLFGVLGESLVLAGFQRWLSIAVGATMLLAIFAAIPFKSQLWRIPSFIKSLFGQFLHKRTFASIFALGATNGLLPCGLVYMAAAASIATGTIIHSMLYMSLFGLGTLPMLMAISFAGKRFNFSRLPFLQRLAPIAVTLVALLLIARGKPFSTAPTAKTTCPFCASGKADSRRNF